jgi:hypothetical protein
LIGADPLNKNVSHDGVYKYEFEMVRSTPTPPAPLEKLSLALQMEGGKLTKIIVPELFMYIFPRGVLLETMRQAAHADVLQTKRLVRARIKLSTQADAELPSLEKTLSLLGEPLDRKENGELQVLIYRYHIRKDQRNVPIIARLGFSSGGDLQNVFVKWDTSSVDVHYLRD